MIQNQTLLTCALLDHARAEQALADALMPAELKELVCREAISSLYYAAFHIARSFAMANDSSVTRGIPHEHLWKWFLENKRAKPLKVGKVKVAGEGLHELRKQADYDNHLTFDCIDMLATSRSRLRKIVGTLDQDLLDACQAMCESVMEAEQPGP